MYRENATFRDPMKAREAYREKEMYKDKDSQREREMYLNRERQYKGTDDRKRPEPERIESRLRLLAEDSHSTNHNNEKENRDKTSGDKELEDLRSRLLSKRISKELQSQETKRHPDYEKEGRQERHSSLDKHQQERRKKLLEAGMNKI